MCSGKKPALSNPCTARRASSTLLNTPASNVEFCICVLSMACSQLVAMVSAPPDGSRTSYAILAAATKRRTVLVVQSNFCPVLGTGRHESCPSPIETVKVDVNERDVLNITNRGNVMAVFSNHVPGSANGDSARPASRGYSKSTRKQLNKNSRGPLSWRRRRSILQLSHFPQPRRRISRSKLVTNPLKVC